MLKIRHVILSIILQLIFLSSIYAARSSVKLDESEIFLGNDVYWALTDEYSTVFEAEKLDFQLIENSHMRMLNNLTDEEDAFLWLKINFTIPEELKKLDLGLSIEYVHFADKLYLNGRYVDGYGKFPPHEKPALFVGHYYNLPYEFLNQDGVNTILIKVWCHGRAAISKNIILSQAENAENRAKSYTLKHSKNFQSFLGGLFCSFLIFFLMWLGRRKEKFYLFFSLANIFTLQLSIALFAQEAPIFYSDKFNYLIYMKYVVFTCFLLVNFFIFEFMIRFLYEKTGNIQKIVRAGITTILIAVVWLMPTYGALMKAALPVIAISATQYNIVFYYEIRAVRNKKDRAKGIAVVLGFIPFTIGLLADLISMIDVFDIQVPRFYIFYGWQTTIIYFLAVLVMRFLRTFRINEYLNKNLSLEVEKKTADLSEMNKKLQDELIKNRKDLQMASIVQQKFLPPPMKTFIGWDIAVCYDPLEQVSGDMYDYFSIGKILDGFFLFDVSGHGISSSLITVLSKNILAHQFVKARARYDITASSILKAADKKIVEAKGSVDNYLTGVMCVISNMDDNDVCQMQLANAGHPHPILYSKKENNVSEVVNLLGLQSYGAIGLNEVELKIVDCDFEMGPGDVLVCFSDGLIESMNEKKEQFGKVRVMEIIKDNANKTANEILNAITIELRCFMESVPRSDDLTVMVLKREHSEDFIEEIGL